MMVLCWSGADPVMVWFWFGDGPVMVRKFRRAVRNWSYAPPVNDCRECLEITQSRIRIVVAIAALRTQSTSLPKQRFFSFRAGVGSVPTLGNVPFSVYSLLLMLCTGCTQ